MHRPIKSRLNRAITSLLDKPCQRRIQARGMCEFATKGNIAFLIDKEQMVGQLAIGTMGFPIEFADQYRPVNTLFLPNTLGLLTLLFMALGTPNLEWRARYVNL